jgi:hypothetical protein
MQIHPNKNWRILSVMSLALAMSGLAVQAAHAMPTDQGPFGTSGGQGFVPVDSRHLAVPIHAQSPVPVDSRYMSIPIRPTHVSVPVDSRHIALPIHGTVSTPVDSRPIVTNTPVVDATPLPTTASDGFNWGDASLGALSAFAVMLLAVSLMLVLRNRNRLVGLHG